MIKILIAFCTLPILLFSNNVFAQTSPTQQNQYETRLKELETKFEKLSSQKNPTAPNFVGSALENAKLGGFIQIDGKWYHPSGVVKTNDSKSDGADIKRARLNIEGVIAKDFFYRFENDFADSNAQNNSSIKDAFIAYNGFKGAELKIGQFKQPFSIEKLTSDINTTFMERSVAVNPVPDRQVGFSAAKFGQNWQITGAIFGEAVGNENRTDDSKYSFVARTSYAPINNEETTLHLAAAADYMSKDRVASSSADLSTSGGITYSGTVDSSIDHEELVGFELAYRYDNILLQGEYIFDNINYDNDNNGTTNASTDGREVLFNSYYVQASMFLSGEHKEYDPKKGIFSGVKVKNPIDKGGIGAWELALRYSDLDQNDGAVINGDTNQVDVGLNWYLNNNLRLTANYSTTSGSQKYDTIAVRAQLSF